jgi:hypothetical protein
VARPPFEVADILDAHGDAFIAAHRGHLSLGQLKVISAIRACRTAALGGHVARCDDCAHTVVAYNSCRNRHCPKCQGAAAKEWLADRQADLLPVAYYHVVFTLPAAIGAIALQNKAVVYDLLLKTAAETLTTIAADPKHLGARIGLTAVLHTWGSALTHHPHVHIIVPGGGLSPDGSRWITCRPRFFLSVRVLSRLFRRLFLDRLAALHEAGRLRFFSKLGALTDRTGVAACLALLRRAEWVVYAKRPFAGPEAVLAYLSRYTHRVAISNSRIVAMDGRGVTFRWKDYRARGRAPGHTWIKTMTLPAAEFIRRFLLHVLPDGFHRIRHYGLVASAARAATSRAYVPSSARQSRPLTTIEANKAPAETDAGKAEPRIPCLCCGGRMIIIERFARGSATDDDHVAIEALPRPPVQGTLPLVIVDHHPTCELRTAKVSPSPTPCPIRFPPSSGHSSASKSTSRLKGHSGPMKSNSMGTACTPASTAVAWPCSHAPASIGVPNIRPPSSLSAS